MLDKQQEENQTELITVLDKQLETLGVIIHMLLDGGMIGRVKLLVDLSLPMTLPLIP